MIEQSLPAKEIIEGSILLIIGVTPGILLYLCKYILKKHGYFVSWEIGFFRDLRKMYKLAKNTEYRNKQFVYYLLPTLIIICIPIFFIIAYFFAKS